MTAIQALADTKKLIEAGFDVTLRVSHRKNKRHQDAVHDHSPPVSAALSVPVTNYGDLDHLHEMRAKLRELGFNAEWDGSSEFDIKP